MGKKHIQQSSLSKAALLLMKSMNLKERNGQIPIIEKKRYGAKPQYRYRLTHNLERIHVDDSPVWYLSPKKSPEKIHAQILYLHGGSYELGFHPRHWNFIARLADTLNARMVVPDYPLAPEHHARDAISMVEHVYDLMRDVFPDVQTIIMGDSAGGGLSLALTQHLVSIKKPIPTHLALFSPWLDVTMSNPKLPSLDSSDPLLNIQKLKSAGLRYAGDLSPEDPRVSPMFGSMQGLPHIMLFVGTADLFLADCRLLTEKAEAQGTAVSLYEIQGFTHPGVFLPIPEARWIIQILKETLQ
jgi:acetyl esterase/lipase